MKKAILATIVLAGLAGNASAEGYGKDCTTVAKDKWLTVDAIEKIVKEHGYTVGKSKVKGSCVEVYVRDAGGKRHELFIDPATGSPAGTGWTAPEKKS